MKNRIAPLLAAALLSLANAGCTTESAETPVRTEVTIGGEVWMTKNLNLAHFRNGDPIPEARTEEEWRAAAQNQKPAWCYYNNDSSFAEKYGRLYNRYAISDPRGLAPAGWHIPTDTEWQNMLTHLGGENVAGNQLRSPAGWGRLSKEHQPNGFDAQPAGIRTSLGNFDGMGEVCRWWGADAINPSGDHFSYPVAPQAHCLILHNLVNDADTVFHVSYFHQTYMPDNGFSVRCIKD